MESTTTALAATVRNELLHLDGVSKFSPNRRFVTVFSEGGPADSLFYVEAGLVKLFKRGEESKEIIIDIIAPDNVFGEQCLGGELTRNVAAEILQEGVIYVIPRDEFLRYAETHPDVWHKVSELLIRNKRKLEKKIELLCLQDVEYRIMYYLSELANSFGQRLNNQEYSIPLSQGELASLIGATRETTSTTLNSLARRGLIRLGRRQLIVISPDEIKNAAEQQSSHAVGD
jgi:CRP/FNR family transcriptional regulator